MHRRPLIAGNWKMNGLRGMGTALARDLVARMGTAPSAPFELLLCPPATLLEAVGGIVGSGPIRLGAQDCHGQASGAFTGDIAAPMLADLGCQYVIVGHSERRHGHGETDATVREKAIAARQAGLCPIVCVGETEAQREAGDADQVVTGQLKGSLPSDCLGEDVVVAYEPVWAIGTGRTASTDDIAAMHGLIRRQLEGAVANPAAVRILYGGSVKPGNAAGILAVADVDGALVGGASLEADSFWAIAQAVPAP